MLNDSNCSDDLAPQPGMPISPIGIERRRNVRVMPTDDEPVMLSIGNLPYEVTDISLGGVAFIRRADADVRLVTTDGARFGVEMGFPNDTGPFSIELEVLGQTDAGVVRCVFVDPSEAAVATIDDYVTMRVRALFSDYFFEGN
ncbi:MAG: PilZ domain-containing protein [Thiotrichales bacterium]